jgi:hypothetical protein
MSTLIAVNKPFMLHVVMLNVMSWLPLFRSFEKRE